MVSFESEQEMGGDVLPSLHAFLAHPLPRNRRSLQTLRSTLSLSLSLHFYVLSLFFTVYFFGFCVIWRKSLWVLIWAFEELEFRGDFWVLCRKIWFLFERSLQTLWSPPYSLSLHFNTLSLFFTVYGLFFLVVCNLKKDLWVLFWAAGGLGFWAND